MASERDDPLISSGLNDLLLERLDVADAVHDAPAQLHVRGAFSRPPPPFQGTVRDGPAVGEFLLRQAIPFHVFLHLSNSVWLRPNEGVKENARQVRLLRSRARRKAGRSPHTCVARSGRAGVASPPTRPELNAAT